MAHSLPRSVLTLAAGLLLVAACSGPGVQKPSTAWRTLFDGRSLDGWESISYGGEGEVALGGGVALLPAGAALTGIRHLEGLPQTSDYEIEVRAKRVSGNDFFCGLTIPIGGSHATVILGGWGGGLCGLSCLDGADASMNETKCFRKFEDGVEYSLIVRVEGSRVLAWVNRGRLFDVDTAGRELSLRGEMLPSVPLGISAYITTAELGPVRWRPLKDD